jgi:putative spermidine/putrescine transport system substrate-binding protein
MNCIVTKLRTIRNTAAAGALLTVASLAPACAADPTTIVLGTFGGLWQQTLEKALVPFQDENNVKVRFVPGSSVDNTARVIAARNAPEMDVVLGEELTLGQGKAEGVWEKLDPAIVTHLKDTVEQARMPDDQGVAVIIFRIGMFYRTDAFKKNNWPAPTSWGDLADRKYCHRAGFNHPNVSHTYFALMMLGGGKPDDVVAGAKRLAAIKDCIDTLDPSAPKTLEKVQIGEYDIGVSVDSFIRTLAKRGVPVRFLAPKEGAVLQPTTAVVVKNAPHPELAQKLVNELLSPRMQKILSQQMNGASVNKTIPVSAEEIENGALDPSTLGTYARIQTEEILKHRRQYIQDAVRALGH